MLLQHDVTNVCPFERLGDWRQQQVDVEVVPVVTDEGRMLLQMS
jgi:hypothetical protein